MARRRQKLSIFQEKIGRQFLSMTFGFRWKRNSTVFPWAKCPSQTRRKEHWWWKSNTIWSLSWECYCLTTRPTLREGSKSGICSKHSMIAFLRSVDGALVTHWLVKAKWVEIPQYSSPYINFELRIPSEGFRMPGHRFLIPSDGFLILSDGCWMPIDRFRNLSDGFRIRRHGSGSQAEEPNQASHARTHWKWKKKLFVCCIQVNPLYLRSDNEIREKQEKIEGVAAPLGDSSENSQLLQKLLYQKYQGIKTEKVRSIITIEISAFSYQKELNNLKSVKRYKGAITKGKFSTNLSCNGPLRSYEWNWPIIRRVRTEGDHKLWW